MLAINGSAKYKVLDVGDHEKLICACHCGNLNFLNFHKNFRSMYYILYRTDRTV